MTMKKIAILLLVVFMLYSQAHVAEPGPLDCYDACSTACVQKDTRKMARCDRKCDIKCNGARAAAGGRQGIIGG